MSQLAGGGVLVLALALVVIGLRFIFSFKREHVCFCVPSTCNGNALVPHFALQNLPASLFFEELLSCLGPEGDEPMNAVRFRLLAVPFFQLAE
jgi:hypothetical protein